VFGEVTAILHVFPRTDLAALIDKAVQINAETAYEAMTPEERVKLQAKVDALLKDGLIHYPERVAELDQATLVKTTCGSSAASLTLGVSLHLANNLGGFDKCFKDVPQEDKAAMIASAQVAVGAAIVAVSDITTSIKGMIRAQQDYQQQVMSFLRDILPKVKAIRNLNTSLADMMVAIGQEQDMSDLSVRLEVFFKTLKLVMANCKELIETTIPAVEKRILAYIAEKRELANETRKRALTQAMSALGDLASGLFTTAATKGLSALIKAQQLQMWILVGSAGIHLISGAVGLSSWLWIRSRAMKGTMHIKAYEQVKDILSMYVAQIEQLSAAGEGKTLSADNARELKKVKMILITQGYNGILEQAKEDLNKAVLLLERLK